MSPAPDVNELLEELRQHAQSCEDLAAKNDALAARLAEKPNKASVERIVAYEREACRIRSKKKSYEHAAQLATEWAKRYGLPVGISP